MKYLKKHSLPCICAVISVLILFLSFNTTSKVSVLAVYEESVMDYPTVIVDAGHGGEDGGAQSVSGLLEKDVNLAIALCLRDFLITAGFDVLMIREDDKQIYDESANTLREKKVSDTHNRLNICNRDDDSIYVSIHQNMFSESKYSGAQVFYSPNNELSVALAESVRNSFVSLLQPDNIRSIKPSTGSIYILDNAKTPCILIECGFLSNDKESALLATELYRKNIAFAVHLGIIEYCYNNLK